jgi:hypothetical protein
VDGGDDEHHDELHVEDVTRHVVEFIATIDFDVVRLGTSPIACN